MRKIIHIDLDAFFASIEQRDHPSLQGRPIAVGGDPNNRGVVASASYEARRFGVRSAMSSQEAKKLCRDLIFVPPHFEKYSEASRAMHALFGEITPLVEPLSIDEAYLDVTQNSLDEPYAFKIAQLLRKKIFDTIKVTASAGVGPNKFIAKLASDFKKPDGLVIVPPEKVFAFIENLAVEKFWGVGPATTKKLHAAQLFTAADIRKRPLPELEALLGSYAHFLYELAHGRDDRAVDPHQEPKSRGSEITFDHDVSHPQTLLQTLGQMGEELAENLLELQCLARTVTLKLRYSDFKTITRSRTLPHPTGEASMICETGADLLFKDTEVGSRPIRLIGLSVSGLIRPDEPLQLWFHFLNKIREKVSL